MEVRIWIVKFLNTTNKNLIVVNNAAARRGIPNRKGAVGGKRGGRTKGPEKTAAELDAELDAYVNDMKI